MKAGHGRGAHKTGSEDLHSSVKAVVHHEVVGHADAVRFHGMSLAIMVVAHLRVVEIRYAAGVGGRHDYCFYWPIAGQADGASDPLLVLNIQGFRKGKKPRVRRELTMVDAACGLGGATI